jgi:hypothetical protein
LAVQREHQAQLPSDSPTVLVHPCEPIATLRNATIAGLLQQFRSPGVVPQDVIARHEPVPEFVAV